MLRLIFQFFFPIPPQVQKLEEMSVEDYLRVLEPADRNTGNMHVLWKYADTLVKTAVWEIKYARNNCIAEKVGEIAHAHIASECEDSMIFENQKQIVLIPIPSSKSKRFKKGYNQTELLCEMIKKFDKENLFEYRKDVLVRIRETVPQTRTKTRKDREKNPKNSFGVVYSQDVRGKTVVLIDDVMTTGSTLKEATRVLKEAGVGKVKPFVIAH
ncbi:MAG: phosphoribosyltransferase family protein [Patescibacteria group bacterium]|nr:phosphoribosyltransferase family protein [bacterium]MDZ4240915.1 phosphoribosyltransferase family protein [Patescibacteria group bacterium]